MQKWSKRGSRLFDTMRKVAALPHMTDIDLVKQWLTENTTGDGSTYTLILHANYSRWLECQQIEPLPLAEFGFALRLLNIDRQRDRRGSLIALALKPAPARLKAHQPTRPAPATMASAVKNRFNLR